MESVPSRLAQPTFRPRRARPMATLVSAPAVRLWKAGHCSSGPGRSATSSSIVSPNRATSKGMRARSWRVSQSRGDLAQQAHLLARDGQQVVARPADIRWPTARRPAARAARRARARPSRPAAPPPTWPAGAARPCNARSARARPQRLRRLAAGIRPTQCQLPMSKVMPSAQAGARRPRRRRPAAPAACRPRRSGRSRSRSSIARLGAAPALQAAAASRASPAPKPPIDIFRRGAPSGWRRDASARCSAAPSSAAVGGHRPSGLE